MRYCEVPALDFKRQRMTLGSDLWHETREKYPLEISLAAFECRPRIPVVELLV